MRKHFLFSVIAMAFSLIAFSQSPAKRAANFNLDGKVAIQGYDPVAYFKGKALKGKKELAVSHQGVTYWFASEADKAAFVKNPSAYEPQYGGWCAFAMGDYGKKVEVDLETFKIIDGKLYLFYNKLLNNTLNKWNKNEATLKKQGDANWNKIIKQ